MTTLATSSFPQNTLYTDLARSVIEISGADRVTFLNNFCTADIKRLKPGELCEAFVLNLKGKLLGHVHVLCHETSLEVITVANQSAALISHWDAFVIREDVAFRDKTPDYNFVFLFKPTLTHNPNLNPNLPLPSSPSPTPAHTSLLVDPSVWPVSKGRFDAAAFSDRCFQIINGDFAGPGLLIRYLPADHQDIFEFLVSCGLNPATDQQLGAHRIRHGTPWFGIDADASALPQELGRDEKAISFTKGCYLGQETVARIDALGHVNRKLACLRFDNPIPVSQAIESPSLSQNNNEVGRITSVAYSELDQTLVALAMVKRQASATGTQLTGRQFTSTIFDPDRA